MCCVPPFSRTESRRRVRNSSLLGKLEVAVPGPGRGTRPAPRSGPPRRPTTLIGAEPEPAGPPGSALVAGEGELCRWPRSGPAARGWRTSARRRNRPMLGAAGEPGRQGRHGEPGVVGQQLQDGRRRRPAPRRRRRRPPARAGRRGRGRPARPAGVGRGTRSSAALRARWRALLTDGRGGVEDAGRPRRPRSPSTSRRMRTARWVAGRCWSAATKASSTLSRSSSAALGGRVGLQPDRLGHRLAEVVDLVEGRARSRPRAAAAGRRSEQRAGRRWW